MSMYMEAADTVSEIVNIITMHGNHDRLYQLAFYILFIYTRSAICD